MLAGCGAQRRNSGRVAPLGPTRRSQFRSPYDADILTTGGLPPQPGAVVWFVRRLDDTIALEAFVGGDKRIFFFADTIM